MAYGKKTAAPKKRARKPANKMGKPPLIRGKEARSNAGFQENISRERALGKSMKRAVGTAYGEADLARDKAKKKAKAKKKPMKKK